MKLKEKQQAKVITDGRGREGSGHHFKVGRIVTIIEVGEEDYWCSDGLESWWLYENELELLTPYKKYYEH